MPLPNPLPPNAPLTFTDYTIDDAATTLVFSSANPGAGTESAYTITLSDAEVTAIKNATDFKAKTEAELRRKLRGEGIASVLGPQLGTTVIVGPAVLVMSLPAADP